MQIYSHEKNDNLEKRICENNTIAFNCEILNTKMVQDPPIHDLVIRTGKDHPLPINDADLFCKSNKTNLVDSLNALAELSDPDFEVSNKLEQKDLYYLNSVLVSAGWNKNDDVFGIKELWDAKDTPVDKQFNYMHNDADIIGHIIASMVVDHDGNVVEQSVAGELPEKIDIITRAVIYRAWSDRQQKERIEELINEIGQGLWSVSMECIFSDFDYAIIGPNHVNSVLARTEESSFLTKHLRAYGGNGEFQGYRIGRLLKGFYFSGKGLVAKPANPRSIILNNEVNLFDTRASISFNNFLTAMENHNMNDNTKQIEDLQAELESTKAGFDAEKSEIEKKHADVLAELSSANESVVAEKDQLIASLETKVKELEDSVMSMAGDKEKIEKEAEAFQKDMQQKAEELEAVKEKYAAVMKEMKGVKRMASLIEAGATEEAAAKILQDFAEADDAMFESVVALIDPKPVDPKPAPKPAPEPVPEPAIEADTDDEECDNEEDADASILEEVTDVASTTMANPESPKEEKGVAMRAAASWIRGSVLQSTKNLKN